LLTFETLARILIIQKLEVIAPKNKTRKRENKKMRTQKKQNSKVPKSAKTRLSDLTPKKDARGGYIAPTPPIPMPRISAPSKKQVTL